MTDREIDDTFFARVFERFQSPVTFNPLNPLNLAGPKPVPRHRTRSFNQRDIARALRAAKAAGVEARVVIETGRITLVPVHEASAREMETDSNPWDSLLDDQAQA